MPGALVQAETASRTTPASNTLTVPRLNTPRISGLPISSRMSEPRAYFTSGRGNALAFGALRRRGHRFLVEPQVATHGTIAAGPPALALDPRAHPGGHIVDRDADER